MAYTRNHLGPRKGRFAIVTTRGPGCGGRLSCVGAKVVAGRVNSVSDYLARHDRCSLRMAKSRGPGARSWRQVLWWCASPNRAVASAIGKATGAIELVSPGRTRHKPSNHCAGKAGRFRLHLWFFPLCILLAHFARSGPWVPAGTRSSLRPLFIQRSKTEAKLGQIMPRECWCMFAGWSLSS